ncbi:Pantothenate synthetase [Gammaproteobacteria bacterium]
MTLVIDNLPFLRKVIDSWKGLRIGLVPTMGNLHEGHLQLIRKAKAESDRLVVSLFVNPLQFGPSEDYAAYPRTFEEDYQKLLEEGTDLLFAPSVDKLYPLGQINITQVSVPGLSDILCGERRPGHFTGVATIVTILFHLIQPKVAFFGEKDFQQLTILRRLIRDLHFPIEIVACPTVRELDGLAMSSRNRYLSPEERARAPMLYLTLCKIRLLWSEGQDQLELLEEFGQKNLLECSFKPEYCAIRTAEDLSFPKKGHPLVVLAAAKLGRTRLIDNLLLPRQNLGFSK